MLSRSPKRRRSIDASGADLLGLAAALGIRAQLLAQLAPHSGVGVGGPADLLVVANSCEELVSAIRLAGSFGVEWRVYGGLTNMLLPDSGLRGLVVLNHARGYRFGEDHRLTAEAGAAMVKVARDAVQRGWGGLTWAVGLPGTVGGAVVNNAGAFGGEISETLRAAEILMPDGQVEVVDAGWFEFRYRYSRLKGSERRCVVLSVEFQLEPRSVEHLTAKAREYTERRQRTQPPGKTLGSTFKNPADDYAGRLLDAAGLKGAREGGFVVSTRHANFFINEGGGTAADYRRLMQRAQDAVCEQFGVLLEPEIEIVPEEAPDLALVEVEDGE